MAWCGRRRIDAIAVFKREVGEEDWGYNTMTDIHIEVDDKQVRIALEKLIRQATELPMMSIATAVRNDIQDRFKTSTAPDGSPWAPLSPVTRVRRRKGSDRPLLDTGTLRNSIQVLEVGRDSATVGTREKYAATHQYGAKKGQYGKTRRGGPIPWGDVPARPFIGVSDDAMENIRRLIIRHLGG